MKWRLTFGVETSVQCDDAFVPTIYSGFKVFYLRDVFWTSDVEFDETKYDETQEEERDAARTKIWDRALLDDLAKLTGVPREGFITAIQTLARAPGDFWEHIKIEGETLSAKVGDSYIPFRGLSSSEKQLVLLDIFMKLAEFCSRHAPTIFLLDHSAIRSLDDGNLADVLNKLGKSDLPFQLIVVLGRIPSLFSQVGWTVFHLKGEGGAFSRTPVSVSTWTGAAPG
jgi:hypothetical protein